MRVCVVGAGAAGLCAARHLAAAGANFTVTVYEQSDCIGGTWVYTDTEELFPGSGLPVHSSMYKSLRTNLPKEIMGFPDFPIPAQDKSYLPAIDILQFLTLYANHFHLQQHIKFQHYVKKIEPETLGWNVTITDLRTKKDISEKFDAIMICNGHYHTPHIPRISGIETFPGLQLHSHSYRVPDPMAGKNVIVLGAGPSGLDLALEISKAATQVILSHHTQEKIRGKFPDNVMQKPDVESISNSVVTFSDGSKQEADVLFYCTGYKYSFPFLSPECGVLVVDNSVQPLYKHLINIHKPSMCFIGLPYYVCAFTMFDIQVQYFLKVLQSMLVLPSSESMLSHTHAEVIRSRELGLAPRQFHMMGPRQAEYYDSLTIEAGLRPTPAVLSALHTHSTLRFQEDLEHFREDVFQIVDDHSFVKINKE